jgi:tartrate-resistant acid phosphatase type 5
VALRQLIRGSMRLAALPTLLFLAGCDRYEVSTEALEGGLEVAETETILVVGDWGGGTSEQADVAAAMADRSRETEVGAIITTGDNFYFDDVEPLMEPFAWAEDADIPFVVSWGNHDIETPQRIEAVETTFAESRRWALHGWGPVDVIVLDSTQVDSRDQIAFLERAMESSEDPTIVVFHHPPYSCGTHGGAGPIAEDWVSRFDDDVFLVLNGHEHNYQRFEAEGVAYIVTGGGGRFLTPLAECADDHPPRLNGEETHHFLTMDLSPDAVTVRAIDTSGDVIDEITLPLSS